MRSAIVILFLATCCFSGCGKRQKEIPMEKFNPDIDLKVSVLQSGKLLANGAEIRLDELDSRLAQIKSKNGAVWYYREGAKGEPPPIAMEVMKLVVKHRIPITMSGKPDFSDDIDEYGNSHPRK